MLRDESPVRVCEYEEIKRANKLIHETNINDRWEVEMK